jgi:glyoxylase-like metal-dependent hydrolase (beta-lactamase superfamily II)
MKWPLRVLLLLVAAVVCAALVLFVPMMTGRLASPAEVSLPGGARELADGHVNVFMLRTGGESVILFDCGEDRDAKAIQAELKRIGLDQAAVKSIFLTHGHPDHVAGCAQFPAATVYALAAERPFLEGTAAYRSPLARVMGRSGGPTVKATSPLSDGQVLRAGSLTVKVLALPGHTPGGAAYLVAGVLLLGDAATASRDRGLRPAEWLFSDDKPLAIRSLKGLALRLEAEQAQVAAVAFSHSGPLESFKPLAEWAHRP